MAVLAGSLADIKHVVFMLQSGRSFDHVSTYQMYQTLADDFTSISAQWPVLEGSQIQITRLILMGEMYSDSPSPAVSCAF